MSFLDRYRSTGADPLFGDPRRAHRGVSMEGYFWRITDPPTGRVVIALCGANEGPEGPWSTIGLAAMPNGFVRTEALDGSWTDPDGLGVRGGFAGQGPNSTADPAFAGNDRELHVNLGEDARLDVTFHDLKPWPHRLAGGSSIFQSIPSLNQYWHPWLPGGRASGRATVGGETWEFDGAQVYAEKAWGREGFPEAWWWGQAQGFAEPTASLAFAGGIVTSGPMRVEVTALVVMLPDGRVIRLGDPVISPVRTTTTDEQWHLSGRGFGWRIEVTASAPLDQAFVLPVPLPSEHPNTPGDLEHLVGDLKVTVSRFGRHVWTGETSLAALEHGGLDRARAELRRRGLDDTLTHAPPVGK